MNKFMEKFAAIMLPISQKMSQNRYIKAISSGMMLTIPFSMIGAIANLLSMAPDQGAQELGGLAGAFFKGWADLVSYCGPYATAVYSFTLGMMALVACVGITYTLSKSYKIGGIESSMVSLAIFYIVVEGDSAYFGGTGIFIGILVAIVSTEIYHFCSSKNITIKLPDSVPETISQSFSALIPFIFSLIILGGLYVIINVTTGEHLGSWLLSVLTPAIKVVDSYPVILLICLFGNILWAFGIHGHAIIFPIIIPFYAQAITENYELVAQGLEPVLHPVLLADFAAVATYSVWALTIMMIRSRSKTLKAIGKAIVAPGLFVMEPVFFGTPIAFNFILIIPYILLTLVNFGVFFFLYSSGIMPIPYIFVSGIAPLGLDFFLVTRSLLGFLVPWILVLISIPVWWPFFKIYERQCIAEEEHEELELQQKKETLTESNIT